MKSKNKETLLKLLDEINLSTDDITNSYLHYSNMKTNFEIEFQKKTNLNELDIKILFLGVFLQITRQFLISNDSFRFNKASDGDKVPDYLSNKIASNLNNEKYIKVLTSSVPYDATNYFDKSSFMGSHGLSGANHRYTTLGHDPLLGWIFGPMNIVTETLTKKNILLDSYLVKDMKIVKPIPIYEVFCNFFDEIRNDKYLLGVAVLKQAFHFSSDCFTKMGLPLPIINNFTPELTEKIIKNNFNIDFYSVTRGVFLSNVINYIIAIIHQLYYNPLTDMDLYKVKTKKIILYSNIIASSSNIIYTSLTKNFKQLDVGGFITTLLNLYKNQEFIRKIKEEYINSKLDAHYEKEIKKLDDEITKLLNKLL